MSLFLAIICMPHVVSTLSAIQILWVNLITDAFPALALGVDPMAVSYTHLDVYKRQLSMRTVSSFTADRLNKRLLEGTKNTKSKLRNRGVDFINAQQYLSLIHI